MASRFEQRENAGLGLESDVGECNGTAPYFRSIFLTTQHHHQPRHRIIKYVGVRCGAVHKYQILIIIPSMATHHLHTGPRRRMLQTDVELRLRVGVGIYKGSIQ